MALHETYVIVVQGSVGGIIDVRRDDFFDGCVGGVRGGELVEVFGLLKCDHECPP